MTVKELIDELKKYDQALQVVVSDDATCTCVDVDKTICTYEHKGVKYLSFSIYT